MVSKPAWLNKVKRSICWAANKAYNTTEDQEQLAQQVATTR